MKTNKNEISYYVTQAIWEYEDNPNVETEQNMLDVLKQTKAYLESTQDQASASKLHLSNERTFSFTENEIKNLLQELGECEEMLSSTYLDVVNGLDIGDCICKAIKVIRELLPSDGSTKNLELLKKQWSAAGFPYFCVLTDGSIEVRTTFNSSMCLGDISISIESDGSFSAVQYSVHEDGDPVDFTKEMSEALVATINELRKESIK